MSTPVATQESVRLSAAASVEPRHCAAKDSGPRDALGTLVGMTAPTNVKKMPAGRTRETVVLKSERGVLQLLQRARLDLDACRLGSEHALYLRERIDAGALLLRWYRNHIDLEQTRQREGPQPLLVN
jgi:hypothetical protein